MGHTISHIILYRSFCPFIDDGRSGLDLMVPPLQATVHVEKNTTGCDNVSHARGSLKAPLLRIYERFEMLIAIV